MIPCVNFNNNIQAKRKIIIVDKIDKIKDTSNNGVSQKIISKSKHKDCVSVQSLENLTDCEYLYINNQEIKNYEEARVFCSSAIEHYVEQEVLFLVDDNDLKKACLEGMLLGAYHFDSISNQTKPKQTQVYVAEQEKSVLEEIVKIVEEVAWARDMINLPLSHLSAEKLAEKIKSRGESYGIHTEILGKEKLKAMKMGGILAVNRGSLDPPTMSIASYEPDKAINEKPYILVGKGVVYDTGGMSLKPTANSMDKMKSDMGGAACMASTIMAIAKLQLPIAVKAIIPATDNRPGQNAFVPGDVVEMFDQTTVEVLNTDAEGRMILADALAFAQKFDPELTINAATLTGSAARAIGPDGIVAMGNMDDSIAKQLTEAVDQVHERLAWTPFWDDYAETLKSDIADIKHLGGNYAGHIIAGKFLEHFTDYPFVHLDIAGPTFIDQKKGYRAKGGTGYGVRMLTNFFQNR